MAETMKHGQPIREPQPLTEAFLMYFLLLLMQDSLLYFKTVNILTFINITLAYSPWEIFAF